ncbi:MAG: MMPL family transporter [Candidatus Thalassarchaeaceae archaeon]|nr:MMPL family transporter [Candidatus Thalassarchaeaceae archaeon]
MAIQGSDKSTESLDKYSFKERIQNINSDSVKDAIIQSPNRLRRSLSGLSATQALVKFPIFIIVFCLVFTGYFTLHSGAIDCRKDFNPSFCNEESSMNVNGDLEVYLPDGSQVSVLIEEVEEDWTTNVMIIYVESEAVNVTTIPILKQIDAMESAMNSNRNDGGEFDDIIYVLSISAVIKEVNSSAVRVAKAFASGVAASTGQEEFSEQINETIDSQKDILGNYAIPDEQGRVDQILDEMPQNALDKLVRDVGREEAEKAFYWNRAVIIMGISSDADVAGMIEKTQREIDYLSSINNNICPDEPEKETDWECLQLKMALTGPAPITNAVTEESFNLFWDVFPVGVVLVAITLFLFHCDLLQTGRFRFVQGIKVLIISGLPTLCSVFLTMGIIGWSNYEVTMTVIIVGPIVLALGVSYGLHITNRYAEAKGTPNEKMEEALSSTGRAVFLSAITTIIGFVSLTFTPMAPIQTVGWSLAFGIVVVYVMTMLMVPNLTILLDLKKPSHPPPKVFVALVSVPVKWTKVTLVLFIIAMIFSAGISRENVESNLDLLEMAPQDVDAVQKMKTYSDEFESGQPGFLKISENIGATADLTDLTADDPFSGLEAIERLEGQCAEVDRVTAVSIVFLMKAIAVSVNVSGAPVADLIDDTPAPQPIKDVARLIFDNEQSGNASFWRTLDTLDAQELGGQQAQNFLIYVFYNSLTDEMRELFISSDYSSSLIYIDMPFMDVVGTETATNLVNKHAANSGLGGTTGTPELIGVASVTIEVNNLIVGSQWSSLLFALLFTIVTLGLVFRDILYALLTTVPVGFTVAMQWMIMDFGGVELSLVTVMIGSILVGVGVDFSIHIANRVRELGGNLEAIKSACSSTGMSLAEATTVTTAGMFCAFGIPIPAIKPFITVIIILLIIAAISALILLPAIYALMVKLDVNLTGGVSRMVKTAGLKRAIERDEADAIDATLIIGKYDDAW